MTAAPATRELRFAPGTSVETHCPYCALQCAMTLTVNGPDADGRRPRLPVTVSGRDFPTNRGGLCRKGWTSAELLAAPDRLLTPLVRGQDGELRPASWHRALNLIAERIRRTQDAYGRDAVGVFGGGGLTNEKAYQLGKFARVALRTAMIDYNGRFCMSSAAAAANRAFGLDRGLPFPLADLGSAATVLVLGSNPADTMPPLTQHLTRARERGGLIVVDPRRSSTAELTAEGAGLHLAAAPGTDLALLLGLAHVVVQEKLLDEQYLLRRTSGSEALIASLAPWWPEHTARITGVPADQIRVAARKLAAGRSRGGSYIITGRGVEQHSDGTDTVTAAINLALLLGLPGTPGSGYGTLTGQGNGQGGREHGQKADQLPGYRRITDPDARRHVARVWGVDPDSIPGPGVPAVQLLENLGRPGGVRVLLVHGSNPAVSAPDVSRVRERLASLDLLVVCDFVLSETAAMADVVLPVPQWAEESGTMTNLEGRVIERRQAVDAPAQVRSELWIMSELAARLDVRKGFSTDPQVVFTELRAASTGGPADYSGLDEAALADPAGAHWPYPAGSGGTPRMFAEAFGTPDGLARMTVVRPRAGRETVENGRRSYLVTGRLLGHYQSGAQTRRVPELLAAEPEPRLELHPATAAGLGIGQGDRVEVSGDRGRLQAVAEVTSNIRQDTVFLPFHFPGDTAANLVTSAATDPISGMPEFKLATVDIRKVMG